MFRSRRRKDARKVARLARALAALDAETRVPAGPAPKHAAKLSFGS